MKKLFFSLFMLMLVIGSCKKDNNDKTIEEPVLNEEQLTVISENFTEIGSEVMDAMTSALTVAADSGYYYSPPDYSGKNATKWSANSKDAVDDYSWYGPDFDGWYCRTWTSYSYTYTEKFRHMSGRDTVGNMIMIDTAEYRMSIEYDGADGSYSNVTETQLIKYLKNQKVFRKGYWDWSWDFYGFEGMGNFEWEITFDDWDFETGAGIFDWYWGGSSLGGDYDPMTHRLNIQKIDEGNGMLHVYVRWDSITEYYLWEYDYETPYETVNVDDIPGVDNDDDSWW
jgi:hypothetical protein